MSRLGLPTLIGFLATGFLLNAFGLVEGNLKEVLSTLSDLGITLLLFTIGLKIKVKTLFRKEIITSASFHMILSTLAFSGVLFLLSFSGLQFFAGMSIYSALIIGFALSFSSTVFVVKSLEDRGEMSARHGRLAIGVLIIQDIFAVLFITLTNDKIPSLWALGLPIYIYLIRYVLNFFLNRSGHGEMLTVFGFFAPLILGAFVFDLVHLKYDLGALVIGMLLVSHMKVEELYDRMMSFKDFFLIAFFINIGLSGTPTVTTILIALSLLVLVFFKGFLFNVLFSFFDLKARNNFLTSLSLMNYSEFGLIVGAVGMNMGYVSEQWLIILAVLMSFSFLLSSPLSAKSYELYEQFKPFLTKINRTSKEIDCQPKIMKGAEYLVIGIGSIGFPALAHFSKEHKGKVLAIDYDKDKVNQLNADGYQSAWADTTDREFWEETDLSNIKLVVLAMSDYASNFNTLKQINKLSNKSFKVTAICHYADEKEKYEHLNVDYVYYYKKELGEDFADHALEVVSQNR